MKVHHNGRRMPTIVCWTIEIAALLITAASIYPLRGVADESPGVMAETQALPPIKSSKDKSVYYPDALKRFGLEGKVLAAFDVGPDGRVTNLSIIFSDESAFENIVKEYMSGLRFEVPSNWANSANRFERYHMGFVFCLPPSSLDTTFGVAVSPVIISGSRIPGAPIRNPPAAGATGRCVG
jgi:hypothetical protein